MADKVEDRRQSIVPPANNMPYVVAVVVMMGLGVVAIVGISFARPNADNGLLITAILGFLAPTTVSLLSFMKAQETHLSVNSRLDAFMSNAKIAARAEGVSEGRAEGRSSADARTDSLAAGGQQYVRRDSHPEPVIPSVSPDGVLRVEAPVMVVPPKTP